MHDCTLGAGVRVRVDAANPRQWQVIWVDAWDDDARPLLEALIGSRAVRQLDGRPDRERRGLGTDLDWLDFDGADPDPSGSNSSGETTWTGDSLVTRVGTQAVIDLRDAQLWLRVAAVDALDRWVHLPLNQALIAAERGVARVWAAKTLSPGRARNDVMADALRLTRAASWALVQYLGRLARSKHPAPEGLRKVLTDLIEGYQTLAAELSEPDQELQSVVEAGRGVLDRLPTGVDASGADSHADDEEAGQGVPMTVVDTQVISRIDPRQVPARVVRISANPTVGEIRMRVMRINGREAVEVEVPAYGPGNGDLRGGGASENLAVRLIDKVTGTDVEGALLTLESGAGLMPAVFRAVVPLPRADLCDLRADVFDGTSAEPPVPADDDASLLSIRRTAVLLGRWRHLVAAARLGIQVDDVAGQVRAVSGDPLATADELTEGRAPTVWSGASAARRAMTDGVGYPLVAEVDAVSGLIAP